MLLKSASDVWLTGEGLGLEPVRQNHFELEVTDNNGKRMPDLGQYTIQNIPSISDPLQIAQYAPVNSYFPVPGMKEHAGSVPLTFRACTDTKALAFFVDWRNSIYSPSSDEVALYSAAIGSGKITPYKPGEGKDCPGEPEALDKVIELQGIWPVVVSFNEWSMDADGEHVTFQVTMAVTDMVIS